ncbi:MAG: DUF1127 domain-containing protein, partial [Methylobacteriaceae bacterium]|nr:DUF1127 domain-containing protein [Methylobacteriaceae bacterium]
SGNMSNALVGTGNDTGAAIVMMVDRSTASHSAFGFGIITDGPRPRCGLTAAHHPKPDPYAFMALSEHTLRDIGLNRFGITVH